MLIGISPATLAHLLKIGALPSARNRNGHLSVERRAAAAYRTADLARRNAALDVLAENAEAFGFYD